MQYVIAHWATSTCRQLPSVAINAAVLLILAGCCSLPNRCPGGVDAYEDGASRSACQTLQPDHRIQPQDPTSVTNPFTLEIVDGVTEFEPGQLIKIRISAKDGNEGFKGFMLQARDESSLSRGQFIVDDTINTLECKSENDTITHSESSVKKTIEVTWRAPDVEECPAPLVITFRGSVAKSMQIYWTDWNVTLTARPRSSRCTTENSTNTLDGLSSSTDNNVEL